MTNPFYNFTDGVPVVNTRGSSALIRNEFSLISYGFDAVSAQAATFLTSALAASTYASLTYSGATYAPLISPALTGTPTAPTQAPTDNSTRLATTAFVQQISFSSTLPNQTGNNGKILTTDGANASWVASAATGGTVTSVAASVPAFLSIGGSPVTTSGTLAIGYSGTALPAANGGTGIISYTIGDLVYASGASALSALAAVGTGKVLLSAGAGTAPTWGAAPLSGGSQAVTGTLAVGNGGTGATTLTGLLKGNGTSAFTAASAGSDYVAPSGALGTPSSGTLTNCTADGTNAVGFKTIPQNSKSADYTTLLTDSGKHIFHPEADTTARTFTIDSNANVAYPIGTAITFVNQNAGGAITIVITSDTMRLAGPGTTGSRTLAANGVATAIKITSTEWIISGTNLT